MKGSEQGGEGDLVRRFRAGDREAFTAVYQAHHRAVFRFALHMTGDPSKAGEITQDVFVWLIHHAQEFDPSRGELSAFLIGVARKFVQRLQQNERRWMPLEESCATAPEPPAEETEALKRAIAALPVRYREVVVLCDLESRSYEEAAATLGCAVGTVRSRLHRARELLGRKLQAHKEAQRCSI
jgi:RNA polymerase sigma-70 factor (ECF subfamily)